MFYSYLHLNFCDFTIQYRDGLLWLFKLTFVPIALNKIMSLADFVTSPPHPLF